MNVEIIQSLLIILLAVSTNAQGKINLQGCTEAFVRLSCPSNDIISVTDMRISEVDPGHPCHQGLPPKEVPVPEELHEFCRPGNATEEGHTCMYVEDICEDKSDCAFYVSPHYFKHESQPTTNSEVVVSYECNPGSKRKAEIGFAAFVATVGIVSLLVVGGLLVWRILTTDQSTYADFRPGGRTSSRSAMHDSSGADYGTDGVGAAASVNDQHISVQLQAAPGINPQC